VVAVAIDCRTVMTIAGISRNAQAEPTTPKILGVTEELAATATNKIKVAKLARAVSTFTH
jgi:hypothetical protein